MIARIWHGYTAEADAAAYERLLKEEIFNEIDSRNIKGYRGIQLLKREMQDETEFTTIMWFEDIEAVRQFAGEEYEKAYVPEKARKILKRFDEKSAHCKLTHSLFKNL